MAARNDITGMVIKSKAQTEAYRSGWDNIFAKKTPEQWLKDLYNNEIVITDPDGWRADDVPFDKPISRKEFEQRMCSSTIIGDWHKYFI